MMICDTGMDPAAQKASGGLIYIAANDSRFRSERMHYGPRQKQVHANNKTPMNTYMAQ